MNDSVQVAIANVAKKFGDRTVLADVSLTINSGETVALIGPSGGGKSTLLRCINGLNTFDSGEIRVGPYALKPPGQGEAACHIRRLFGMVFQDFQLFPHLTALQNVMEAPCQVLKQSKAEARERGMALLQRVGLESHATAFPQQLSGGQKQRVAIAR